MTKIELIKTIRFKTDLSFREIEKAIDALGLDASEEQIIAHLREQGALKAQARQDRETNQGAIFSYVHEGRLGVMVEIKCETDFVSRSDAFKELGNDLALHIAATQPKFLAEADADQAFIEQELEIARHQLENEGKPAEMIEKILTGKKNKIVAENALLSQPFLKDNARTVQEIVTSASQTTGEKITVSRFVIFNLNA